jgi:hypothetical protein
VYRGFPPGLTNNRAPSARLWRIISWLDGIIAKVSAGRVSFLTLAGVHAAAPATSHQAIAEEDLLAGGNIGAGEQYRAIRTDHALGDRWRSRVGQFREPPEHAKAQHDRNNR